MKTFFRIWDSTAISLYGSRDPKFFGPASREEILMLDDFLGRGDAGPIGYGKESPTHALMGRFGNVLLINGEPKWETRVRRGEVVRLLFDERLEHTGL